MIQRHIVIVRLDEDQHETFSSALRVLKEFCGAFSREDILSKLNLVTKTCLITDAVEFQKPADRQDLCYVMEQIAKAISATYDICEP